MSDEKEYTYLRQVALSYHCMNQSKQKELLLDQILQYPMSFEFNAKDDHNLDFHALSHRLAYIYQKLTNLDKRIKE